MMRPEPTRRLAYAYYPGSFPWMTIVEAARRVCVLIWMVDREIVQSASMLRFLQRVGEVVDVTGLTEAEAAAEVALARPDGMLALADGRMLWTAKVAEALGLPFHSVVTAEILTDKGLQRERLKASGLPTPAVVRLPASADAAALEPMLGDVTYPAVLKPAHGESSRDVVFVDSSEAVATELPKRLDDHDGGVLVEEYLPDRDEDLEGPFAGYVSVESLLSGGLPQHLAVAGRAKLAPPFRESGAFIPSALSEPDLEAVLELASRAIEALQIARGCVHTEIKMTPDGPRVIEVNGRIGGGGITTMLEVLADINLVEAAMRTALGDQISLSTPTLREVAFEYQVQPPQTMRAVKSISGLDELRETPGVKAVTVNRGPGATVDWRAGTQEYLFSVAGQVADHADLADMFAHIIATTSVEAA